MTGVTHAQNRESLPLNNRNMILPLPCWILNEIRCNGLLYGLQDSEITKLQRLHNVEATILTSSCKNDHITPVLQELHWLPVRYRIYYKILLLTLNGMAPAYINDLINIRKQEKLFTALLFRAAVE